MKQVEADAAEASILARAALGPNDLAAFEPFVHEVGNELGRILQIAIHDNRRVRVGMSEAGGDGGLVAEVAGQLHYGEMRIGGSLLEQQVGGAVGATIVHVDDLPDNVIQPLTSRAQAPR